MPARAHEPQSPRPPVRLQRLMAEAGVASRRECEAMIESGRVCVNGRPVARLPVFVDPAKDTVTVDGDFLRLRTPEPRVYIMLNKPERTLTATRDAGSVENNPRRTVIDLVRHPSGARLYPIGRLDYHGAGLVLLTNDGELTQRITHARYGVAQTYRVWVAGEVDASAIALLERKVGSATDAAHGPAPAVRIESRPGDRRPSGETASGTVLEVTVRGGRKDRIADLLRGSGCRVRKVVRVAVGPVRLRAVAVGQWRELFPAEIDSLRRAAGLKPIPVRRRGPRRPEPAR